MCTREGREESDLTGRSAVSNLYSESNEKLLQNFQQGKDIGKITSGCVEHDKEV